MIHARRLAHRRAALALAGALPVVLVAGLALRPEVPPRSRPEAPLLAEAGFATTPPAAVPAARLETDVASYEIEVLGESQGRVQVALRPTRVILVPDLLVYWLPDTGPDALPASGGVLLGSLSGTSRRRLALPAAARSRGQIVLYSLPRDRVVDRLALGGRARGRGAVSVSYRAVQWNRQKLIYDALLLLGLAAYLGVFLQLAPRLDPNAEAMNLRMRAFGSAAFILLHLVLSIGPLCRIDARFLPLLYNRRHMGVLLCGLALHHADLALTWYHDYGNLEPLVSLFVSNTHLGSLTRFPFELLGVGALLILVLMAATSHDFWLANLTAPVWKALHMGVYVAYALLVGHVALGALQSNESPWLAALVGLGATWVVSIHALAALRERAADRPAAADAAGWVEVCRVEEIPEKRARVVFAGGERIAVFRYDGRVSALSGVCQHQNGPLGEGRIVDGLVTCPWHGFQYDPASGAAPAPFTEKLPTFQVELRGDRVFVNASPHPPGTAQEPARVEAAPA